MTCTAARKSSPCNTKSTAMPNRVITSIRAECTGLRATTTPMAPDNTMAAATTKVPQSTTEACPVAVAAAVVARSTPCMTTAINRHLRQEPGYREPGYRDTGYRELRSPEPGHRERCPRV